MGLGSLNILDPPSPYTLKKIECGGLEGLKIFLDLNPLHFKKKFSVGVGVSKNIFRPPPATL